MLGVSVAALERDTSTPSKRFQAARPNASASLSPLQTTHSTTVFKHGFLPDHTQWQRIFLENVVRQRLKPRSFKNLPRSEFFKQPVEAVLFPQIYFLLQRIYETRSSIARVGGTQCSGRCRFIFSAGWGRAGLGRILRGRGRQSFGGLFQYSPLGWAAFLQKTLDSRPSFPGA